MIGETVTTLHKTMQLFAGRPSEIALPLAYWLTNNQPPQGTAMRPDQDDCGLIWYSPLVPMQAEKVTEFTTMVTSICIKHQIEPLITLTSFSDRSFDSTIPILFKKMTQMPFYAPMPAMRSYLKQEKNLAFFLTASAFTQ